jgi:hypothetical protein
VAEGVEEVPGIRNLETMIQNRGQGSINITASSAERNDSCKKSDGSDFFDSLGYKATRWGDPSHVRRRLR